MELECNNDNMCEIKDTLYIRVVLKNRIFGKLSTEMTSTRKTESTTFYHTAGSCMAGWF